MLSPEIVVVKDSENILICLCASRNQTEVEQFNVFAMKSYIKHILTPSNVHNRLN